MTREQVFQRLKNVFEDVFEDTVELNETTTAADVPGWDSLSHIALLVGVENEFGVKFSMKDVVHLRNVGEMVSLVLRQCGEQGVS